jgi:hypothetical protein
MSPRDYSSTQAGTGIATRETLPITLKVYAVLSCRRVWEFLRTCSQLPLTVWMDLLSLSIFMDIILDRFIRLENNGSRLSVSYGGLSSLVLYLGGVVVN